MKITDAMKIIDKNWIDKKKGFRVSMHRYEATGWVFEQTPGENAAPLDSDVTSWRLAWKLAQSTPLPTDEPREGDMINIFVVDQDNNPIFHYASGEKEILNKVAL